MKSLALNLLKTLLLLLFGAVLAATSNSSSSSSSVASKKIVSMAKRGIVPTTTPTPPSLQAPPHLQLRRHTLPATAATSKPHTITTTMASSSSSSSSSRRQRLALARHAAKQTATTTTSTATTIMTNSKRKPILSETSTLDSTRLVRRFDGTTTTATTILPSLKTGGRVRQQRSFQSNGAQPYEDTERQHKRRQYTRSYSPTTTATATTTRTSTKEKPQHLGGLRQRTVFRHDISSNALLRQSKQTSLPLDDNGTFKITASTTTATVSPSQSVTSSSNNHGNTKQTIRHNQQTPKTPRMIQRLVAGHIQNSEGHSTYQVSAVTTNSTITNSTASTKLFSTNNGARRPTMLSSSYRNGQLKASIRVASTTPINTIPSTSATKSSESLFDSNHDIDYHDDDEALLDDPGDFDNWDNGILRLSAGSGKENSLKTKKSKEDSKKTLADQVRDGKYGLIEKELFRRTPKRPGVLSYLPNKEVPEDNERNFGGLNEEDIWLAEDHLLVIKGGNLNDDNPDEPWPAIDDYNAAGRQIKIPKNPKIPPPFPVQLEENGPVQLIGNNKLTVVYPVTNESLSVYTVSAPAHNTPTTDDNNDEKNLIARPGKTKTAKENQPGYNYPAPALPWLYNNQTIANPSLNEGDGKPINFPILGPFLYGRNGSLDNINGTEDLDEDDPSLYYPPAYSFVYKSNYSNPVPPGPLVPGIVVPPPPEQFSKLEKSEKERKPWYSSTQSPPIRYRIYSTTTVRPTTTTPFTATTTMTEQPYRQVVTKISEYTPKIINIATPVSRPIYTPTQTPRFSVTASSKPPSGSIETVPVPVAVPIPIYSVNVGPNVRPNIVSFVPTTPEPNGESLSKANPIYYEYFEAKRQQSGAHAIDDFLSSTAKPIASPLKPIKLYATSKRPFKLQEHHRNYLQPVAPNHRYEDDSVVVITPKPAVRYKPRPIFKQQPLQNFEQEVNAIRQTLRYYKNQELRDNNIPRTSKAKPLFDYNFDDSKTDTEIDDRNQFQAPAEYDVEPFKPMVTYSPAVNDKNAFRALAVDKIGDDDGQPQGREDFAEAQKYSTTTLVPVSPQNRNKKLRIGAKYLQQPLQQQSYINAPQRQSNWVAVKKKEFSNYVRAETPQQRERYQEPIHSVPLLATRNRESPGYYYAPIRQNNRFYEEPFQNIPSRKIVNYRPKHHMQEQPPEQQTWSLENDTLVNELPNRPPINPDAEYIHPQFVRPSVNNYPYKDQQQPRSQYQQQPQQQIWSLHNDTLVNELPNRPPINPDAEFIDPYLGNNYPYQQQQPQRLSYQQQQTQQQPPPPPISHQSQYYAPHPPFSLLNDQLVNYRQPVPPINPDSEWISHPQVIRNPQQQSYRPNNYRLFQHPPPAPITNVGGGEAAVFYLPPKYRRANRYQSQQYSNNNNNGK